MAILLNLEAFIDTLIIESCPTESMYTDISLHLHLTLLETVTSQDEICMRMDTEKTKPGEMIDGNWKLRFGR